MAVPGHGYWAIGVTPLKTKETVADVKYRIVPVLQWVLPEPNIHFAEVGAIVDLGYGCGWVLPTVIHLFVDGWLAYMEGYANYPGDTPVLSPRLEKSVSDYALELRREAKQTKREKAELDSRASEAMA